MANTTTDKNVTMVRKEDKNFIRSMMSLPQDKKILIQQLYGPSVPQMIKNEKIMKAINDDANETLQKRIDAEIANLLRKG